jgi:hypothetical protein
LDIAAISGPASGDVVCAETLGNTELGTKIPLDFQLASDYQGT